MFRLKLDGYLYKIVYGNYNGNLNSFLKFPCEGES